MKKSLLTASLTLLGSSALMAAAPEGNLYLLGLNGDNAASEVNQFVLAERTEDDIDEGLWRWLIPTVNVTAETGTLTVGNNAGFKLGFDADNEFGITNSLTATQSMIYLAPDGAPVSYTLIPGEYTVSLALFEDLDGDMGGDSWMLQIRSLSGNVTNEAYYLVGFNGTEEAAGGNAFSRETVEEDGETSYIYTLRKYHILSCPDGFTVLDAANDVSYGMNPDFEAMAPSVTEESPMAFMAADGAAVKCTLPEGYYDVTFTSTGSVSMISFLLSEDQTPLDELDYYLVGLNGVTAADPAYKFTRNVESGSYEEDGETVEYTTVTYTLSGVQTDGKECGLRVISAAGDVVFGYDASMASIIPNGMTAESPFAIMAVNGEDVKCSLPGSGYEFVFAITGEGTGMLSARDENEDAVEGIIDSESSPIYFDLQGRRVEEPAAGLYIRISGQKVEKIIRR